MKTQKAKMKVHGLLLVAALLPASIAGGMAFASPPFQNQDPVQEDGGHGGHGRGRGHGGFVMGVCVGQTLAQQGVTLPLPQAGQPPQFDAATKAAIDSAVASCRQKLSEAGPVASPTPSVSPSSASSGG